jgi:signal transduction histidine kinase
MPNGDRAELPRSALMRIIGAVSLVCLLLGVLETLQQHASYALRDVPSTFAQTVGNTFVPWLLLLPLLPVVVLLANRLPLDRGRPAPVIAVHILATMALVLVHEAVTARVLLTLLPSPPISYFIFFTKLVTFRFAVDALVYWGVVGAVHAVRATRLAREREQTAVRLEASLATARLTALREQLQPHFLFNSLNAVSTLALRGEPEAVTRALSTLSDLLRIALDTGQTQEVPLAEELAFLDRYLELQQLRFGDRLTVVREVDDEALNAAVPVMLTQPLVENAVRHGIAQEPGPGRLAIRVRRRDGTIEIEVEDSGPGFGPASPRGDGIGLANTRARLAGLYGEAQRLELGTAPGGGARVRVTLPYRPLPVPTPAPL